MKEKLRIVFMGTPEFAVPSLDILYRSGYDIAGVVTAPDKPAGRGLKVSESAVKKYAAGKRLKILQPEKLRDINFIDELRSLGANLQVVVAFRMLPESVWNMPSLGTFNLHGSLLPEYRGAAPINWAIINGEKKTGVTTFFLKHEIDTGDIIFQREIPIGPNETAGELHDKMMAIGAELVLKTLKSIENRSVITVPQLIKGAPKPAPKIFREDCRINWNCEAPEIHNLIRGLSPYPTAWATINEKQLKIFRSTVEPGPETYDPGFIFSDGKSFLKVAASKGMVSLLEVQMEGKKKLPIEEFLRGFPISPGTRFD